MESLNFSIDKLTENLVETSYDGSYKLEEFLAIVKENLTDFTSTEGSEEDFSYAEEEILRIIQESQPLAPKKIRRRHTTAMPFWDTYWGQTLCHPNVSDPKTHEGRLFRRRFRLPYPVFTYLVELCNRHNIFGSVYVSKIPIEAKILGSLRILARGNCADEISELATATMGESTVNSIFKRFIAGMCTHIYPAFVKIPTGELLEKILKEYADIGLPGCCGSMDCTHVKWNQCPKNERHNAKGKEGYPTLAFQVVVDHSKRVLSVSQSFTGNINDKTICNNDLFSLAIKHGSLQHVQYELWNSYGKKYKCQGGYLIVDGGYIDHICFIEPEKHRLTKDAVLFSEWIESVRKDVECFFGILKIRWRLFLQAIYFHSQITIEQAFKTACCLHNMILIYDQTIAKLNAEWENVRWENIHPDDDEEPDTIDNSTLLDVDIQPIDSDVADEQLIGLNGIASNAVDEITVFTIEQPKSELKQALQTSLNVQWIKQQLHWPKRFSNEQKLLLPLRRAADEMFRALYHQESNLRRKDEKGKYTISVNEGLFSKLSYKRDEVIASFRGTVRTQEEYIAICVNEPWRRKYSISYSTNGNVLDCWDNYVNGLCIASYANSPRGCLNLATGLKAVDNCRLSINLQSKTMSLKCGVDIQSRRSPKGFSIQPGTELLWDYGDSFVSYEGNN